MKTDFNKEYLEVTHSVSYLRNKFTLLEPDLEIIVDKV
jgi:hypothetical protein